MCMSGYGCVWGVMGMYEICMECVCMRCYECV